MSELRDWKTCGLWKELETRNTPHAEECQVTLRRLMPKIQQILNSGGTSPKDFTLHDAGHSFRVAERMQEIIGDQVGTLTVFELSLLLLAAYLHDIGMTPELKRVDNHFGYLLTADKTHLPPGEIAELQTWLDDKGYEVIPPISDALPLTDKLMLAREITTYYCRHRHNDWSGEWIRANLANENLSSYSGWIEDLVLLCQSHHFGFEKLTQLAFRPRRVASPSEVVNLRFLALALRTADILEFDPERTPDIILRHRDVASASQIYWWKDKEISLRLTEGKVVITARPSSARMHRAIEETADSIDVELALCKRIADDLPLGSIPGEGELPYHWKLQAVCHRDIEARAGMYEYINGAFRPDTQKLLSLLSGTSLYQTPLHAIRELVQNAFDAVSERIAYLRLEQRNPSSVAWAKQFADQHRVSLQLELEGNDAYLVCTDNGIGMTKAIIRDRVLVAGSKPRHDVRALDRRCRDAGFDLCRSGQFGIGVLSYFMIASCVEIETLRALESGDSDSTKWHFETEGIGSFGELRKIGGSLAGTRVRLRLNRKIFSNPVDWYAVVRQYLERTLVYCPCEFSFASTLPQCRPLELTPGWSPRNYTAQATDSLRASSLESDSEKSHLLSRAEREKRIAADRKLAQLEQEVQGCLRWRTEEGVLSDKSAHYEIRLPYFTICGNESLAFFQASSDGQNRLTVNHFQNGTYLRPEGRTEEAWKGMAIGRHSAQFASHPRSIRLAGTFLRINWISNRVGEIMANRDEFHRRVHDSVEQEISFHWRRMFQKFIEEFKDSEFAWFNERITELNSSLTNPARWARASESRPEILHWDKIRFPALSRASLGYLSLAKDAKLEFETRSVEIIPLLSDPRPDYNFADYRGIGWNSHYLSPDRVVRLPDRFSRMAPIWLRAPNNVVVRPWLESKFPPQWRELCGAHFGWYAGQRKAASVWNKDHPLVKQLVSSAWEWCNQAFQKSIDPLPFRNELLLDRAKAASWLLQCIDQDSSKVWEGLSERDPEFLPELLRILFPGKRSIESRQMLMWIEDMGTDSNLRVVDLTQWRVIRDKTIEQYLPRPSDGWEVKQVSSAREGKVPLYLNKRTQ